MLQAKAINRQAAAQKNRAPRRASAELVTLPAGAVAETWFTTSGSYNIYGSSGWLDYTSQMSIQVAIVGSDIYVQGLAYYFEDAWIKGTIADGVATFPNSQFVGEDSDGSEYMVGSNDASTIAENIVFNYDETDGVLTAVTTYIFENGEADELRYYGYWHLPVFSKEAPAGPEVVVAPENLVTEEYALVYSDYDGAEASGSVKIGFDGNEVYFQGLNSYLPEAWAKGTLEDGIVTLEGNQYFGAYGSYEMYLQAAAYTFSYNAETSEFVGDGLLYTYTGNTYADYYNNPVLKKVVEKATTPANPAITALTNGNYGWYINFNVPTVDVNGDGLVTSKLSYIIYTDIEKDVQPLTFTSTTHTRLTEDLTEIPYGFTEDYDFYDTQIYLNELYSADWNKIGIKSIYTGGDETHETEIQWYTIKKYAIEQALDALQAEITAATALLGDESKEEGREELQGAIAVAQAVLDNTESTVEELNAATEALKAAEAEFKAANAGNTFDFNAMNVPTSSNSATDGDITEDYQLSTSEGVVLIISPKTSGNNNNRFWGTTDGPQLRLYSGTLTLQAPEGFNLTQIVFNYNGTYWGGIRNAGNVTADSGDIEVNTSDRKATWTGKAQQVVFTIGANTQLNSIEVTTAEQQDELVVLPEGVEAEVWTIEGSFNTNQGADNVQEATEVAFDGNDIYVKGLAYYFPEAWIKGTIADGVATFPSGQFVGEDEYGKEYLLGTSDGQTIDDIYFTYDADAQTLTLQNYILENGDSKTELSFYGYWSSVQLYVGEPVVLDPVVAPEDLVTETYVFKSQAAEYEEDEDGEPVEPTFEPYESQVLLGFDGDDLYIQGLAQDVPEFWVKATKNEDGKYVIPANQYMGTYDVGGWGYWVFDYFFTAVDAETEELTDVVLTLDAETGTLTTDQVLVLNGSKNSLYPYITFAGAEFSKFVEVAATPADPEVLTFNNTGSYPNVQLNVPAVGVNGEALLESKLFYTIYIEKDGQEQPLTLEASLYDALEEDITEIPYTLDDDYDIYKGGARVYLNQGADEIATWTKIGVQSIYYGGDEVHKSNIAWALPVGIAQVNTAAQVPATYYDLQGRVVSGARKGLFIKQYTDADGRVKTEKVLRK
ncbi:MAG: hypothetical protein IJ739_00860 [Bacteroidaceae bacterium]|nr:hypothetical protein [Bacteroidaceae bacterium]